MFSSTFEVTFGRSGGNHIDPQLGIKDSPSGGVQRGLSLERSGHQTEKPSLAIVEIRSSDHHATPFS